MEHRIKFYQVTTSFNGDVGAYKQLIQGMGLITGTIGCQPSCATWESDWQNVLPTAAFLQYVWA